MKKLLSTLLFGKDAMLSGLIALAVVGAIALGCSCNKDFGDIGKTDSNSGSNSSSNSSSTTDSDGVPADSTLQSMVKETTEDFAQAIDTGDFTELYDKASMDFKNTYPDKGEMNNVFKDFIAKKKLILPSLNKVGSSTAEFSPAARIRQEQGLDILVLSGSFPTKPLKVKFDYEYVKRAGQWKLLKLVVNM